MENSNKRQRVMVFQQNGSGQPKIDGMRKYGGEILELEVVDIDGPLPPVIDDTTAYLPSRLACDLVLDFLRHGDLSADLAALCVKQEIPLIASGKKITGRGLFAPPT
jgi:hypothetical protein